MRNFEYPNPVIAERIQSVFYENKLTDKQVAEAIGCERKTIGAYRNCISNPSVKFIRYICKTYGKSTEWLLDME